MRGSFWQNDSLITHILFELHTAYYHIQASPVANFGDQSLPMSYVDLVLCIIYYQPMYYVQFSLTYVSSTYYVPTYPKLGHPLWTFPMAFH